MNDIKTEILDLSRQNNIAPLDDWFDRRLDDLIEEGMFPAPDDLKTVNDSIIADLAAYRVETGAGTVILGMSGGVDSALTAALYKKAGYRVIGVTMPINQNPDETDRGVEACSALGIEHQHIDLTALYNATLNTMGNAFGAAGDGAEPLDYRIADILSDDDTDATKVRIRRGNIRARLRMITLYNLANLYGGFVASTDNLSELAAGFWTLHGDVGDLSPIQALSKSWEVPYLARLNGVPESTVRAKPTDGLGVTADGGDEAQLGCSYLEWDIMFFTIWQTVGYTRTSVAEIREQVAPEGRRAIVFDAVTRRMQSTWFKRKNPMNIKHALQDRYAMIDLVDNELFVAPSFRA